MIGISVKYGNDELISAFNGLGGNAVVTDVNRNIASTFNNTYQDQGNHRYGQQFLYNTLSVKQITITIKLTGTSAYFNQVSEKLGGFLNTMEAKELIFGDEPNKVWEALPSGQPTITVDNSTSPPTATLTITFDVPKAYAENKVSALVGTTNDSAYGSITKIDNNHYKAKLKNIGTATAYPKIKIKHNSDNGWVGVVSPNGTYEVGDPEEIDKKPAQKSEMLISYNGNSGILSGFSNATKNKAISNDSSENKQTATLNTKSVWGRYHVFMDERSTIANGGNSQYGGLTFDIPADSQGNKGSLHDYIWWRQVLWLGLTKQYGFLKIIVTDTSDKFLYGVESMKRHAGLECEYNMMVTDGNGGYRVIESRKFIGTNFDEHNPFNSTRGWSDIVRDDDFIHFYWWGSRIKRQVPALKGKKSNKIHVIFGALQDKPLITHLYLDELLYQKNYVDYLEDVPNRFGMGSIYEMDMATGKPKRNGINIIDECTSISEPFGIPVGESELDIYLSSWNEKEPSIEITWNERYV